MFLLGARVLRFRSYGREALGQFLQALAGRIRMLFAAAGKFSQAPLEVIVELLLGRMKLLIEGFVRDAVRRGGQKRANLGNGLNVLSLGFAQDGRKIFKALRKLFEAPACSLLLLFKVAADVGEPFLDAVEGLFAGGVDHRGEALLGNTGSGRRVQDGADFGGAFIEL